MKDVNYERMEKVVKDTILHILPSSYLETPIYEKLLYETTIIYRVWNLSTSLCWTVIDTLYDARSSYPSSSDILREAKKHVTHVVSSLLPNETLPVLTSRRSSRLSETSLMLDSSPYTTRSEAETSVLDTPCSLGSTLGLETKRQRVLPQLPQVPISSVTFD